MTSDEFKAKYPLPPESLKTESFNLCVNLVNRYVHGLDDNERRPPAPRLHIDSVQRIAYRLYLTLPPFMESYKNEQRAMHAADPNWHPGDEP